MLTIRDRQVFEHRVLDNGIKTFFYPEDTPFCSIEVEIPLGFAHTALGVHAGSAHLIEHLAVEYSKRYPKHLSFMRYISMTGGFFNAYTTPFHTRYTLSVPTAIATEAWKGLCSHIFEPVFTEHHIEKNKGIIRSERNRERRYFPASSELGHYISTQWKYDVPCSLEQIFGGDGDFSAITPDSLYELHRTAYFDPRIRVMIGGNINPDIVAADLEQIPTHKHHLTTCHEQLRWNEQEYHERSFRDTNRYELRIGGIVTHEPDVLKHRVVRFIGRYLVNSVHGPLFQWLRNDKGWSYDIGFSCDTSRNYVDWSFYIPLENRQQVRAVRTQFWSRARTALQDKQTVEKEVVRVLGTQVFHFQTLDDILYAAWSDLRQYKRIISEREWQEMTEACRDTDLLLSVWDEYYANEETCGSFCAVPYVN